VFKPHNNNNNNLGAITGCFQEKSKDSPLSTIVQQSLTSHVLLFLFSVFILSAVPLKLSGLRHVNLDIYNNNNDNNNTLPSV